MKIEKTQRVNWRAIAVLAFVTIAALAVILWVWPPSGAQTAAVQPGPVLVVKAAPPATTASPSARPGSAFASKDPSLCSDLEDAVGERELAGRMSCKQSLQASACFPPLGFEGRTSSVEATTEHLQESLLVGCEFEDGDLILDCSEYPCITFLAPDAVVGGTSCVISNYFLQSPDAVRAEVGGGSWHYMLMLRPGEQEPLQLQAVTGRWSERLRRAAPALASGVGDIASLQVHDASCSAKKALLEADGTDAACAALLDYWGCDDPDPERYERALEDAEEQLHLRLDPECATLRREDVEVDCTREPCTFSFLVDEHSLFCNFGEGDAVTQMKKQFDFGKVSLTPILEVDDLDRDDLEGEFFDLDSLRFHHAAEVMRARAAMAP